MQIVIEYAGRGVLKNRRRSAGLLSMRKGIGIVVGEKL